MATLTFPYDHSRDPMNPEHLGDQIATALSLNQNPNVDINPTQIRVQHPNVTEANRAAIQAVIDAYVFDPVWQDGIAGVYRRKLQQALVTNQTFLAIPSPTAAQNATQIQNLTREVSGLIRVILDQRDSTQGT